MRNVLTFILAGGRGERLDPLTRDRTKPAVPFGGIYRIIDFTLSNCVNSGLRKVYVLTQYKSFSLQKHLLAGWDVVSSQLGEFIDVIPAQQRIGDEWYRGTADAIFQNIYAIQDVNPDLVLILAGDHIYKMNYSKMIDGHIASKADVTVACVPTDASESIHFGVVQSDEKNNVLGFQEKPKSPKTIPGNPDKILASMGIYLFNRNVLEEELLLDSKRRTSHDFGKNIIPQMLLAKKKVVVSKFINEKKEAAYWRDIGTRDAYFNANMDLLKVNPEFNLYDKSWPVRTYHSQYPPVKMVSHESGQGQIVNSMVSGGCVIEGAQVRNSILSPNVKVKEGADIESAVLMEGVVVGESAKIKNAIIDKEVIIPPFTEIGYNEKDDQKRFTLTRSGIVIVGKKETVKRVKGV